MVSYMVTLLDKCIEDYIKAHNKKPTRIYLGTSDLTMLRKECFELDSNKHKLQLVSVSDIYDIERGIVGTYEGLEVFQTTGEKHICLI